MVSSSAARREMARNCELGQTGGEVPGPAAGTMARSGELPKGAAGRATAAAGARAQPRGRWRGAGSCRRAPLGGRQPWRRRATRPLLPPRVRRPSPAARRHRCCVPQPQPLRLRRPPVPSLSSSSSPSSFPLGASSDFLAWCGSCGGSGRYAALRLALHAFLAASMAPEALDVLAGVCLGGKTPSLSALAALLRLLFRAGEVRAACKVFEEMAARGPRLSLATFNAQREVRRAPPFLAAGMAPEALDVLAGVCLGGEPPSLSALAALLRLLFHGGEVRAAWKVFEEMPPRRRHGTEALDVLAGVCLGREPLLRLLFHGGEVRMEGVRGNAHEGASAESRHL